MKFRQLKKWPLAIILAFVFAVGITSTTVLANNQSLTVKADVLNVRLGPGLNYSTMGQVSRGTVLTVTDQRNAWYQVRLAGNRIGWVASWLVDQNMASTTKAKVATVNQPGVIYQYATQDSTQLGQLNNGTDVNVVYQQGEWTQISYQNTVAWVLTKVLNVTDQTTTLTPASQTKYQTPAAAKQTGITVVTTMASNIRQAAGINAPVVVRVPNATKLNVISQSDDWYKVQTSDGKIGYVASWVVSSTASSKQTKAATNLAEATIVLDPGHGGTDVGALSTSGKYEKTYTLETARAIAAQLKAAGANVIMTRDSDKFVDLAPRPVVANNAHADAFISIHFDSSPDTNSATGFTTYYYSDKKDLSLAKAVNSSFSNLSLDNRGVAFGDFEVLRENQQPSILMEMGYINTDSDFKQISSSSYQDKIASDVTKGLTQYFKAK
ncbi:N-acetylmuramoyl-L-alanine amidase [Lacticaseibacillus brantae]|uniref:N-acetylmuramoyl-L-alanine amidase, family 3 n=1 Tax=Lacticaseibacillus brantae DSM 23927 TaxID=1423727 RepID=A0A0R2AZJ8_9LACO|nr:N-acetylmuramoyl-L-alanine amidase [Lacticaseibacillus brantae]KRM72712.1 N-acetylmuramoyl-L-alanine amidase, family 3 [Lacticaseibacillus brantae DSM 23927]